MDAIENSWQDDQRSKMVNKGCLKPNWNLEFFPVFRCLFHSHLICFSSRGKIPKIFGNGLYESPTSSDNSPNAKTKNKVFCWELKTEKSEESWKKGHWRWIHDIWSDNMVNWYLVFWAKRRLSFIFVNSTKLNIYWNVSGVKDYTIEFPFKEQESKHHDRHMNLPNKTEV